jgi:hypothetical protein
MNLTLTINVPPITINIPGLPELAAALSKTSTCTPHESLYGSPPVATISGHQEGNFIVSDPEPQSNEPAATPPAKRTRKRVDDPKQVEAVTGRRVEGLTDSVAKPEVITNIEEDGEQIITTTVQPEPIEAVSALVDEANPESFNWTLDQLKATFVPKIDDEALRAERNAHAKSVLSGFGAQTLSVLDAEHYPAFAAAMTEWYKAKGFELQLPEGAE